MPYPKNLLIAIDGPAGAGKSTAARRLAAKLGYRYVDTGAMYRAAAWAMLRRKAPVSRLARVVKEMKLEFVGKQIWVDGEDATDGIRAPEVTKAASFYAARPALRRLMVARQRALGKGGVVMEGRDIGTVVFPKARVKFFIDASPEERARRRWQEMAGRRDRPSLAAITKAIRERDQRDRTRPVSPLVAARDAVVLDTTGRSAAHTLKVLLAWLKKKA